MRKILLLVFICCKLCGYAQKAKFGVKSGLNLSTQISYRDFGYEPLLSFHVGFVFEKPLSERFIFKTEAVYSRKGNKNDFETIRLNNIDVPLLIMYKIKKLYFLVGPQYSHIIRVHRKLKCENKDCESIYKSSTNSPNIGVAAGLEYQLGKRSLSGVRVHQDIFFSNINIGVVQPWQLNFFIDGSSQYPNTGLLLVSIKTRTLQTYLTFYF